MNTANDAPGSQVTRGTARAFVTDGIRQVYRVSGTGPVCLVHSGGPGVHPDYLRIPELERGLTMVYLDPVGAGDSDPLPDGDYSMPRYARFAEAVLDDMGASAAYFLGHSHGGSVGLQFAIDYPGRLGGLILYDTAPVCGQPLRECAAKEMAAFVQRWPDRPEAAEAGRIGTYDFICPPRFAYEMHDGIPGARLRELPGSGHFGHIEEAGEFAAAVLAFVGEQETGSRA